MKKIFHLICLILTCTIWLSFPKTVVANTEKSVSELDILDLNDEEQIKIHNQKAQEMWENALIQAEHPMNNFHSYSVQDNPLLYTVWENSYTTKRINIGGVIGSIKFASTHTTNVNASGVRRFSSVINIDAYPNYANTSVNVNACDFALIDSNRTIAAQYSLRVGVEQFNGTMRYTTIVCYVEFYTDGSGVAF